MALYTVANLKDSVRGILTGLNLNNVRPNVETVFERVARHLSQKLSIPQAMGRESVTLYDGVIDYTAPTNIFGSSLIDIQPQGISRGINDYLYKKYISEFDREKSYLPNGIEVTFESRKGVSIMRLISTRPVPKIELDSMTDDTGWTASGSAASLVDDETVFYTEPAALRFTCTGSSIGILTKAISSQDFTDYAGVGVVFLAIRIPSGNAVTDLTSITVRLGSDSTNYYSASSTTGFLGAWTVGEFLLVAIDLASATTTGTPTVTAIDYAQIRLAHTATMTNFYIGAFWVSLPSPHTVIYESAAIFKASGANPSKTITGSSDEILLDDASYSIYELECADAIARQQGGGLANGVVQQIKDALYGNGRDVIGLYPLLRADEPSQKVGIIGNWYE